MARIEPETNLDGLKARGNESLKAKGLFGVLLALALIAGMAGIAQAAFAQTWHFTDTDYEGPIAEGRPHAADLVMTKPGTGEVNITGLPAWWYADETALVDVAFGEAPWWAYVWYEDSTGGLKHRGTLNADVYSVAPDGTVTRLAGGSVPADYKNLVEAEILLDDDETTSQVVPEGHTLAVKISYTKHQDAGDETHSCWIYYNSHEQNSRLESPESDPGYPVPELPTAILLGAGLVVVAGCLGLMRYRASRRA